MRGGCGVLSVVVVVAGCRELPELAHGVCGNGVVEVDEDCDGVVDPSRACAPSGTAHECRFTCAAASCPVGWACGDDGVCRHGTGELIVDPSIAFAHDQLAVADVDGDHRADLVAFSTRGAHVLFEDRTTIVASPEQLIGPGVVADLDRDGLADIVAPLGEGLAIGRGELDRTVTPVGYAPFGAKPGTWFLPVRVPIAGEDDAIAALVPKPPPMPTDPIGTDVIGYLVPSGAIQHTAPVSDAIPPASFGPVALRADLDAPSAEDELVVTAAGASRLYVLQPTVTLAGYVAMIAADRPLPGVSDGHLLRADVDGDGDVDVLAGVVTASGPAVVMFANTGNGLATASIAFPVFAPLGMTGWAMPDVPSAPYPVPLAIADLDGDGALDAVSPDAVFRGGGGPPAPVYRRTTPAAWHEAVVVDVDRDGRLDVVVSSSSGIDVLRNRPTPSSPGIAFTRVAIDTAGAVSDLRAGDFDGDGLGDVAFREHAGRDRVRVLFGSIGAFAPSIAAIGLPGIARFEVGRFRDPREHSDQLDDLVVVGSDGTRAGVSFVAGSGDRRMRTGLFLTRGTRTDVPLATVAGRFVGDGARADLVVLATDRDQQRRLWVLPAAPELAYRIDEATLLAPVGALSTLAVTAAVAADVDGDGRDELVVLGRDRGATHLVIATLRGDAAPAIETIDPGIGEPLDLVSTDADRDGRAELLIAGTGGVARWQAGELALVAADARAACAAQLDDDAALELALIGPDALTILDGVTLAVEHTITGVSGVRVRAGDLDGDGIDDLVVGDGISVVRLHSVPQVKP